MPDTARKFPSGCPEAIESLYFLIIHLYTDMILIKKCNILLIKAKCLPFFTCIFATTISGRNVTIRFTGHDT